MRIAAAVMEEADEAVLRRTIKLQEVELEGPREDEVLIRVTNCGVGVTDKGVIHGLEPFPTPGTSPVGGVVDSVGSRVTLVEPGDRMMIGFPFCGQCRTCLRGEQRYSQNGFGLSFSG